MSKASLESALPEGERLLLDTTTLIAYLDGGETVSPIATHIVDEFVRTGRNESIVSMVTVMEVLVRPLRQGPRGPYQHVVLEAASLRATYNLRPPDALISASGLAAEVGYLITNDAEWSSKLHPLSRRAAICYLGSHLPFP
jgi:predicted nucleic acid-binding protein